MKVGGSVFDAGAAVYKAYEKAGEAAKTAEQAVTIITKTAGGAVTTFEGTLKVAEKAGSYLLSYLC
jgi:hypothetical protein